MLFEFINTDGTFYKNVCFIGFIMTCYTDGKIDPLARISSVPKTHAVIWRFK
jgi:hypothetical protein